MTKDFSGPILLGTLATCIFSLTMPVVMCSNMNTCHEGDKKRGVAVKILAAHSVRQNTDKRAMYERKGVKKDFKSLFQWKNHYYY